MLALMEVDLRTSQQIQYTIDVNASVMFGKHT